MWVKPYDTIAMAAKTMTAQHWHLSEDWRGEASLGHFIPSFLALCIVLF